MVLRIYKLVAFVARRAVKRYRIKQNNTSTCSCKTSTMAPALVETQNPQADIHFSKSGSGAYKVYLLVWELLASC